jgi:hypothetical protein
MTLRKQVGVLHVHSDYSHDGRDSLESVREFALERGISFVGMTDHAEDLDRARFQRYVEHCGALSDDRVVLIPGLEFRFAGFPGLHLLALGLRQWIAPPRPEVLIETARMVAALTVLAHPVLTEYRVPESVLDGINAIEVWNANYNTRYLPDPRAIRLLHLARRRRRELVGVVGLDQHDRRNDRRVRVVIAGDEANPLAALAAGRFMNVGLTMQFDPAVSWSPIGLAVLSVTRLLYDQVERAQDRVARFLR